MAKSPIFKITALHVRNLRGLRKLDLPEDGMGWAAGFPGVSIVGGANGSGKTTLLCCISSAAELLCEQPADIPPYVNALECLIDFMLSDGTTDPIHLRFLVGEEAYVKEHQTENCYGYVLNGKQPIVIHHGAVTDIRRTLQVPARFAGSTFPRLVFLPSDERNFTVPQVTYKAPGQLDDTLKFVAVWQPSEQWNGSTLELLFSARWADLNAKDLGKPKEATNFERYTKAFVDLTGGTKRLAWTLKGDLVIELLDGTQHPLQDLSSGERQALLLLAELRRTWRPGSLVLIDELELHLHDAWQGRLYDVIRAMQTELGGQVIITTQSHSLFEMAELGTRALIGRRLR